MTVEAGPLVHSPDYDQDPQWGHEDPTTKNPGETQALEVISQEGEEEYYYGDEPIAEEDEEEGEVQEALTEDAYSLIYTADFASTTMLYSCLIVALQGSILIVTLFDLVDMGDNPKQVNGKDNRFNIPAGANTTVTFAQFLGMLLTALVMSGSGDILIGLQQLAEGYDDGILYDMPNATCLRWFMTGMVQSLMGTLLVLDSFILSMASETVIDLILNLTAMHFLQEIDDMFFSLASNGLLNDSVQRDCERVQNLKQVAPPAFVSRVRCWRRVLVFLLTCALLAPYAYIVNLQKSGYFLCKKVYLQFGDAHNPEWAYYSGDFSRNGTVSNRFRYTEQSNTLQLGYCEKERAWTVSEIEKKHEKNDVCNYIFKSDDSEGFDVIDSADEGWSIKTDKTGDVPVDWFKLICNDCNEELCKGECNMDLNVCICITGLPQLGLNCELPEDCGYYNIDYRTRDSLSSIPGTSVFFENEFAIVFGENITLMTYQRAVYIPFNKAAGGYVDPISAFMVFTGRRWIIFSYPQEEISNLTVNTFAQFFLDNNATYKPVQTLKNISKTFAGFSPLFFSDPVNYGGENYDAKPSGVGWVLADELANYSVVSHGPDSAQPAAAKFLCSDCNINDVCQNNGECQGGGYCLCLDFYVGFQCERALDCSQAGGCFHNGTCNQITKFCECEEDYWGNLCQYTDDNDSSGHEFKCSKCRFYEQGSCDSIFSECKCDDGFSGEFCETNLTDTSGQLVSVLSNVTTGNTTSTTSAPTQNVTMNSAENTATNNATGAILLPTSTNATDTIPLPTSTNATTLSTPTTNP